MKNRFLFLFFWILMVMTSHSQGSYEVPIEIPTYDSHDPTMMLIDSDEDWGAINDEDKRYFFVAPGDYTGLGEIEITTSGTTENHRWLVYFDQENPSDISTHPVDMSADKRAEFERMGIEGSYWIIDRLYGTATEDSKNPTFELGASNIIINRVLCEGGGGGAGQISVQGSEIVLQNSVLRNTQIIPNNDIHSVKVSEGFDGRIVNNEIYNFAGDGVQLGDKPESFKGMVIYNNDIYIDTSLYPEEVEEIPHENAIDIKQAGVPGNVHNYVIIKNNRFRNIAHTPGGTSPNPDQGTIDFSNKNDLKTHVLVEGNIFYNCKIPFDTKGGGTMSNFTITKNLIYNATRFGFWITGEVSKHEVSFNTIIGVTQFEQDQNWINSESDQLEIYGNLIINGGDYILKDGGYTSDYNVFYNTTATSAEGSNSMILGSLESRDFEAYCFDFGMHTTAETLCIPDARPTQSAAFTYLTADQYFGDVVDVGVDDLNHNQDWCGALYPASVDGFPVVGFAEPTNLDTIAGEFSIEVLATDADNDLSDVQLFLDGVALGDPMTSQPFSYSWNTNQIDDGFYTLKAKVSDQAGNTTYSEPISVFVDNQADVAPVISLTSPQNEATVANTVTLSANAVDADDDLVGVKFILNGEDLAYEIFSEPFEREWITWGIPDGNYEIWAVARDYAGRKAETDKVTVTVDNSYPPLVSLVGIASDSVLSGQVELLTETSDKDDDITHVTFMVGNDTIGISQDSPFSLIWDTSLYPNGEHKLSAVVEDADGNQVASSAIFTTIFNEIIEVPLGLTEREFGVVPNPIQSAFTVNSARGGDSFNYRLFTLSGNVVIQGSSEVGENIDVSVISKGIYILTVTFIDGQQCSMKVIKSREQ
ncbi:MAG: Ig-like domain-containing protein [Cyclobacteriaceae bacterium]